MKHALLLALLFFAKPCLSQDTERFKKEVKDIQKKYDTLGDASKETVVFTGSSSIRMWRDVRERFPEYQVINSGFGGSQASDLLYYIYDLILRYEPQTVFLYEGDNDVSARKDAKEIISDFNQIIGGILRNDPTTKIMIISPKPSIARWELRGKYKRLNRKLKRLANDNAQVQFIDVWHPMLDGRKVMQDIFIEDGLHMNSKGYDIWFDSIKDYLN
ncbi:GDSL-type esterase/lipase family protein [Pareuzebyella sediminis]|uniref:GDSL-type esterase/lipase family protein n=1 Tax=Pareuzebyella sediminis TaxID=2607998 RepID=UPI0011EF1534|nr:GDSL-type esterase/lipase family protein [Pareuzebyella sediminis]